MDDDVVVFVFPELEEFLPDAAVGAAGEEGEDRSVIWRSG